MSIGPPVHGALGAGRRRHRSGLQALGRAGRDRLDDGGTGDLPPPTPPLRLRLQPIPQLHRRGAHKQELPAALTAAPFPFPPSRVEPGLPFGSPSGLSYSRHIRLRWRSYRGLPRGSEARTRGPRTCALGRQREDRGGCGGRELRHEANLSPPGWGEEKKTSSSAPLEPPKRRRGGLSAPRARGSPHASRQRPDRAWHSCSGPRASGNRVEEEEKPAR